MALPRLTSTFSAINRYAVAFHRSSAASLRFRRPSLFFVIVQPIAVLINQSIDNALPKSLEQPNPAYNYLHLLDSYPYTYIL